MTIFSHPSHHTATRPNTTPVHRALCKANAALALCVACGLPMAGWAQALPSAQPLTQPADADLTISPKVERIVHEDAGSRVQELKVGGQTKQIDVQTKTDMPAYQITPTDAAQGPANPDGQRTGTAGSAGRTTWRLFNF